MASTSIQSTFDKWLGRSSNVWTLLGPLAIWGTANGLLTASASQGVVWISQFGWLGWWWCAFLVGVLSWLVMMLLYASFKEKTARARAIEGWSKIVDSVNPLDSVFNNKRIKFSDISHPVFSTIKNKKFIDCELHGPANTILVNNNNINGVSFEGCDFLPAKDNLFMYNAIGLERVNIIGGSIYKATILIPPNLIPIFEAMGDKLYYPTLTGNAAIDAREPK